MSRTRARAEAVARLRADDRPPDTLMYLAAWALVLAPLGAAWHRLDQRPLWLGITAALSLLGVPLSYWLRRHRVDSRKLNLWVSLGALATVLVLIVAGGGRGAAGAGWQSADIVGLTWILSVILLVVAFRSMTLLSDFDLQLTIGFGLSTLLILSLIGREVAVTIAIPVFAGAALALRLRLRRREQQRSANQVIGRDELGEWRADAGLLSRLAIIIGILATVLSLVVSSVAPHGLAQRGNLNSPMGMRFMRWITELSGSRMMEGAEAAMEVSDLGGPSSEVPVFAVQGASGELWRGAVYGRYDGRRFTGYGIKARTKTQAPEDQPVRIDPAAPAGTSGLLEYTFTPRMEFGTQIYTLAGATHVQASDVDVHVNTADSVSTVPGLANGASYRVWAWPTNRQRPTPEPLTAAELKSYSGLPKQVPNRVRELTRRITGGAATDEAKLDAIMRWLGENKLYTLAPEFVPYTREAVDYFLYDMKAGWCRHFAAAMVVMARTLDIPSRMVGGYASGETLEDGSYLVRAKDAHAWAECWLPDRGWVEYDPTGLATEQLTGLAALMNSLRGLGKRLLEALGWAGLVAVGLTLAVGIAAWLARRRLLAWWRRPRRASAARPRDRRFERLLRGLQRLAAAEGQPRGAAETEMGLAERLAVLRPGLADQVIDLAAAIGQAKYGRHTASDQEARQAQAQWRALRRQWRKSA